MSIQKEKKKRGGRSIQARKGPTCRMPYRRPPVIRANLS